MAGSGCWMPLPAWFRSWLLSLMLLGTYWQPASPKQPETRFSHDETRSCPPPVFTAARKPVSASGAMATLLAVCTMLLAFWMSRPDAPEPRNDGTPPSVTPHSQVARLPLALRRLTE